MASVKIRVAGEDFGQVQLERVPVTGDYILGRGKTVRVTDVGFTPGQGFDAIVLAEASRGEVPDEILALESELQA